jgi:hypothetical protein
MSRIKRFLVFHGKHHAAALDKEDGTLFCPGAAQ